MGLFIDVCTLFLCLTSPPHSWPCTSGKQTSMHRPTTLDVLGMFTCNLTTLISQMTTPLYPGISTPVPRNSSEPVRRFTIPAHPPHPIVAPRNPTNPVMPCVPQPLPIRFSKPEIGPISLANIPHHLPVQMSALPPPRAYHVVQH